MEYDQSKYKVRTWKNPMMLHWIVKVCRKKRSFPVRIVAPYTPGKNGLSKIMHLKTGLACTVMHVARSFPASGI